MSYIGFNQFTKKLDKIMDSTVFNEATEIEQLNIGYSLITSKSSKIIKILKKVKKEN